MDSQANVRVALDVPDVKSSLFTEVYPPNTIVPLLL